jgi:hypothetical protein
MAIKYSTSNYKIKFLTAIMAKRLAQPENIVMEYLD